VPQHVLRSQADEASIVFYVNGERAQNMLDSIGDAVVGVDRDGRVTYLNAMAEGMTGWSRQDAEGQPLADVLVILDGDTREPATNPLLLAMQQDRPASLAANSILVGRHGREFAIEDTATPIHDRGGQLVGAVMVFRDVTAARSSALKLSHLAHHDFLTGLPNRLSLNERLARAVASASRHHQSLAVMFLDMDGFKVVNDSLGHAVGDQLLQSVSRRLLACVRGSDTVSRHGGDEFIVLLAELSRPEDAAGVAGKILASLKAPHEIGVHSLCCPVSIGIGVYPADGSDAEGLLRNADLALLQAKASGRGTFRFFGGSR
jgi:diguanylate cyclase (GGDEF)-like protein/PAS domain S-box-containing protein